MKKVLNIIIYLFILWFLLISETEDIKLLAKSIVLFTLVIFARFNHNEIVKFFQEKDEIPWNEKTVDHEDNN